MGGVWFDTLDVDASPILWRTPFPASIRSTLVTSDCRHGSLSISDLELAATIAHKAVLASQRHVHERTLWLHSDNRAAVAWSTKGASTTSTARAYLLRLNSLLQRAHRYHSRHHFIPAPSTPWRMTLVASGIYDASLLTHFNSRYPTDNLLAHLPPHARDDARRDWGASRTATSRASVSPQRCASQDSSWRLWATFCSGLGHDPELPSIADRVPLLQLFAHRYRTGVLAPRRPPRPLSDSGGRPIEQLVRRSPGWGPLTLA
jgi:hypothetical protein